MRRREFITLVGGAALGLSRPARAEGDGQIHRIGILTGALNNPLIAEFYPAFFAELRKFGFIKGSNLIIEHGGIDEGPSKAFDAAAELIRSKVDVVVAFGPEIALKAAVAASQSVPIVMIAVNFDPLAGGYVSNIARPDKNITGVVYRAPELAEKQLEICAQAFPNDKTIAVLWTAASAEQFSAAQRAAQSLQSS